MVQEEESADVIRKQWVILFARRKMQSRELPVDVDDWGEEWRKTSWKAEKRDII